jgi:alpha-tubulin suppressor-like RCC1 family protein/uncharacterized protein YjdB
MRTQLPSRMALIFAVAMLPACDGISEPGPVPVESVLVAPGKLTLVAGQDSQLVATPISGSGQALDRRTVQWETSDALIATISAGGLLTGIGPGAATITATSEGRSGHALVTVRPGVAHVTLFPTSLFLGPGESGALSATALDNTDQEVSGLPVSWTSSAPSIASVDSYGHVTGLVLGSATITARILGVSATAAVEVANHVEVAGIWDWTESVPFCSDTGTYVFTQTGSILGGTSTQVGTCTGAGGPRRNDGSAVLAAGGITSATTIAFIMSNGATNCNYTGTVDGPTPTRISGTVSCGFGPGTWEAIRKTTVGAVRVVPAANPLLPGETQPFTVELSNTLGNRIFSRPVTWASDDAAVATVSPDGLARGVAVGTTQITATVEGVRGSTGLSVQTLSFTAVAAGGKGSCGLTPLGKTYCWGLFPAALPGAPTFSSLAIGAASACGLTADGSAYCWGDNSNGQLGVLGGGGSETPLPVVGGLHFASLTAGGVVIEDYYYGSYVQAHTCGLTAAGAAYCWGLNSSGQLGTGNTNSSPTPLPVFGGLSFAALSAGGYHSCGLTLAGAAYCWGSNGLGQLGSGIGSRNVPTAVVGGLSFKAIATGTWHTCALTTSGAAYCWGMNNTGQLGIGNLTNTSVPVAVSGGLSFVSIVTGAWHTCALTAAGQAFCWGSNDWGNLGAGPQGTALSPVPVSLGLTFVTLASASGAFHTCGITTSSIVYCWGNASGVGGGGTANSDLPVRVRGQP